LLLSAVPGCASSSSEATVVPSPKIADKEAGQEADIEAGEEEEALPVEAIRIRRAPIEAVLPSSTSLEAERAVSVHSQTSGLVRFLGVEEGDTVREGQLLLRVDDEEQRSALRKAEAQLRKQRRELARYKRLFEDKLLSDQDFNESHYQLEQLEIAFDDARRRLDYTRVKAPISGTVSVRSVQFGDRVQEGQQLFEIVDLDSLIAPVYLPEKRLEELRVGQTARIVAKALGEHSFEGVVKRIAPTVDAKTGTIKVTIAVGRRDGLRPGMYVDLGLVTAQHGNAILVPKRCLVYDRDQVFLFRIDGDQRAERVFVEAQLENRDFVEPREGFEEGDLLVTAGQAGLKAGALVEIVDVLASASAEGDSSSSNASAGASQ